jgi:sugar phosphate isomerase/epimerase
LVLFESDGQDNLLDETEINDLRNLSFHQDVGFNVHLPIDIFLGHEREEVRFKGISILKRVIERTRPLNPSVYILHLDLKDESDIDTWQRRITQSLKDIMEYGIESNLISIETLGYPFEWVEGIIKKFGFSICIDIGHILIHGQNLQLYLEKYLPEASVIHLHGFQDGIDHLGIDRLPEPALNLIFSHLRDYEGIVSIEVFSMDDLKGSLSVLEERWRKG